MKESPIGGCGGNVMYASSVVVLFIVMIPEVCGFLFPPIVMFTSSVEFLSIGLVQMCKLLEAEAVFLLEGSGGVKDVGGAVQKGQHVPFSQRGESG